ncbi:MAG: serine/threonine-protein kinase [Acidobacteriota bacterium]
MPDDLTRWQELESFLDLDEEARREALAEAEGDRRELLQRLARCEAGETPLDTPVADGFADLLGNALELRPLGGLEVGEQVGAYRIDGVLGEGGMGIVYRAHRADGTFDQEVALKLLHRAPRDGDAHLRFLQERQILAGLKHPHIARLLDGGMVREMPYLVLEKIEGSSLTDYCERHQLAVEERLRLLLQACDAVHYAHREGVIHRDLKPSNLMVEEDSEGRPKVVVLDFGIAQFEHTDLEVTRTGQIFGTPGYMSPEQALGRRAEIDRRSDVFSLGVMLYELLCGERPFAGDLAWLEGEPVPVRQHRPNLPLDLVTITDTCLAREPGQRYDSVRALADDLERYLDGAPVAARPVTWIGRWLRRARRSPRVAAALATATAVTLASLVLLAFLAVRYTRDLAAQRQAAVEARRDAEGLLEFMLEDLHQGLDRVGRLDLLEQVARQSLAYFDGRAGGSSPPEIRSRATALHNAGRVLVGQGDHDAARRAFDNNRRLFEGLVESDPDPRWQLELARSHHALAGAIVNQGDADLALESSAEALRWSRRLAPLAPPPDDWAEVHFDSLTLHGWIAREGGRPATALEVLAEARQFAEQRRSDPEWRHRGARAESFTGLAYSHQGDFEAALEHLEAARRTCAELVETDSTNTAWREELQLALGHIAWAHLDIGDLTAARQTLLEARHQAQVLVRLEPGNAGWNRELAVAHAGLAEAYRREGRPDLALPELEASLAIARDRHQRFPDNASAGNDVAWDLLELGRLHRALGAPDQAGEAWREAVGIMQTVHRRHPDSSYYLDTLVQILLELDEIEAARPLLRQLEAAGWAAPDLQELARSKGLEPTSDS